MLTVMDYATPARLWQSLKKWTENQGRYSVNCSRKHTQLLQTGSNMWIHWFHHLNLNLRPNVHCYILKTDNRTRVSSGMLIYCLSFNPSVSLYSLTTQSNRVEATVTVWLAAMSLMPLRQLSGMCLSHGLSLKTLYLIELSSLLPNGRTLT